MISYKEWKDKYWSPGELDARGVIGLLKTSPKFFNKMSQMDSRFREMTKKEIIDDIKNTAITALHPMTVSKSDIDWKEIFVEFFARGFSYFNWDEWPNDMPWKNYERVLWRKANPGVKDLSGL